jgi:hypothetical protein
MKASLSIDVFIKRVEHILTYQNRINGNLYPECFPNHKCIPYYRYNSRALEKQLDFTITKEDYENIIQKDCFLCGKKNNENHINGIDRLDSNNGYVIDNINACCSECNFMKRDYDYNVFISKLVEIYEKHKNNTYLLSDNSEYVFIPQNRIKKSVVEIIETNEIFQQKQYEKIKEKYGDEEYKQIRATEIAKYRSPKTV